MSQRMNFFAQMQKQNSSNTSSAANPSTSTGEQSRNLTLLAPASYFPLTTFRVGALTDPPALPSEQAKGLASAPIPSLNLAMIKQHQKNSSSNGQPKRDTTGDSSGANANNCDPLPSSSLLLLGSNRSHPVSDAIVDGESREECQPPPRLPPSRSATATDSRASTTEPDNFDTPNPQTSHKLSNARRQGSSTARRASGSINFDATAKIAAPRPSSKTAATTFKSPSAPSNTTFSRRGRPKNAASTDEPQVAHELDERTPPPQTRQQPRRKMSITSHTASAHVRPRSSYEMDDEIQLDDGQNRDEPVRKRVKGEPVDDETAYSTDSSPSANRFNHHIPTRQPSDEMIDVDGIVSEVLVGPSHPGPQNALSHTSFQPQPPPRQQLALGEGKLSLIESINDDFESYLEQQQQKADMLRKKWLTCSMEEWEQGGSEISAKFGSLIERVRDGMKSKLQAFSGIDARMADHTKALDERGRSLKQEKDLLVNETGRVVETKGH